MMERKTLIRDHLINTQEQQFGTDPFSNDTDGDSLTDSEN